MISKTQLAKQIAKLPIDVLQLEEALLPNLNHPDVLSVLADLLTAESFSKEKKMIGTVAVNYIIRKQTEKDENRWKDIWDQFYRFFLTNAEISWFYLDKLGPSCILLLEEAEAAMIELVNPIFTNLTFAAQILLYQSFLRIELTQDNQYVFIRQTIEEYLDKCNIFLREVDKNELAFKKCDAAQLDSIKKQIFIGIEAILTYLNMSGSHQKLDQIMLNLALKPSLLDLVGYALMLPLPAPLPLAVPDSKNMTPMILSHSSQLNQIKSYAIDILTCMLSRYDRQSSIQDFDKYSVLGVMENVCPIVMRTLFELVRRGKERQLIGYQDVISSCLSLLVRCSKFTFMFGFFLENMEQLLFGVVLPLIAPTDEDRHKFYNDSDLFIQTYEGLYDYGEKGRTTTVKNCAGSLLQQIIRTIDGSSALLVDLAIATFKSILRNESNAQITQIMEKYKFQISIQVSLTCLTILSCQYFHRKDLVDLILTELLSMPELQNLQEFPLSYFLLFLAYNYHTIFSSNTEAGPPFLCFANQKLDTSSSVTRSGLMLFRNCLQVGLGQDIWMALVKRIKITKQEEVIGLLTTILQQKMQNMAAPVIQELAATIIERLVIEYSALAHTPNHKLTGTPILFKCLALLHQIADHDKYLHEQPSVVDSLWPVFDFFELSDKIEFQKDIINIFNLLLLGRQPFSERYLAFLPSFNQIHNSNKELGEQLVETYRLILTTPDFFHKKTNHHLFHNVMSSLAGCYNVIKNQDTFRFICILLHFAYAEYGREEDQIELYGNKIKEVYLDRKSQFKAETKAAAINFLIMREIVYGGDPQLLSLMVDCQMEYFKGYQGKVLSYGLRRLVCKYFDRQEMFSYMRISIQLLHYTRSMTIDQKNTNYYNPSFPIFDEIDPFSQVSDSLEFLKQNLPQTQYDQVMSELEKDVSLGDVRDLISKRIIDKKIRLIMKVKDIKNPDD